jgi:hypothetical protein
VGLIVGSNVFESAALAMWRCGYSPIPIYAGEKKPGVYGIISADGTKGPWHDLAGWQRYCRERAPEAKAASWGRMSDAKGGGIGVACGYGGLVAIDVDHPDLIEPIRAVLPPIIVEKVGRKGFTAFYRADHPRDDATWWTKRNYRDADDSGLLDFLAIGSQTVLPPTLHKDTGEPYRWTTERTLLNTPLDALPLFADAHRAAMEEVLREHGWNAPEPPQPRRDAVERAPHDASDDMLWHDDLNTVGLENLSAWVEELRLPKGRWRGATYRAVAPWRTSGSNRAEGQRSANLSFHRDGIVDFGSGETFTPIRSIAKARNIPRSAAAAWLRERLGLPDEKLILLNAAKSGRLKATYPDHAVDLAAAQTALHSALDGFEAHMKEWRAIRNLHRVAPPMIAPKVPVMGIRIDAGGGKTFAAAEKVAAWSRRGWRLAVSVSRVDLGEKFAKMLEAHGVKGRVYRGRNQPDPDASDHSSPSLDCCNETVARHNVGAAKRESGAFTCDLSVLKYEPTGALSAWCMIPNGILSILRHASEPITNPCLQTRKYHNQFRRNPVSLGDLLAHRYCYVAVVACICRAASRASHRH